MSKPKYFASRDAEECYTLDVHEDNLRADGGGERTLFLAKPVPTSQGYFWCHAHHEAYENEGCGVQCGDYQPRNGKNGRCRHHGHCYEATEKTKVIKA